jgi:hypothetical protein
MVMLPFVFTAPVFYNILPDPAQLRDRHPLPLYYIRWKQGKVFTLFSLLIINDYSSIKPDLDSNC